MTAEENNYSNTHDSLLLQSNNSLDIRSTTTNSGTSNNTPTVGTPTALKKNSGAVVSTPTAMNDLLAMLDDHSVFVQLANNNTTDTNTAQLGDATDLSPHHNLSQNNNALTIDDHSLTGTPSLLFNSDRDSFSEQTQQQQQQQQQQQYINPNLLNANTFMDSGLFEDHNTNSMLDDFTTIESERRHSEVVNYPLPAMTQSRGSISHSIDFWNLPEQTRPSTTQPSLQHDHNGKVDLMSSFKSTRHNSIPSSAPNNVSPFKIDNELTQLLSDYDLSFSQQKKQARTSSFNNGIAPIGPVRRNSTSDPNRIQKQRASMSILDGNNSNILSKLYGDVTNARVPLKNLSWENAIMSDEEEDQEEREDEETSVPSSQRFVRPSMLNEGSASTTPNVLTRPTTTVLDNTSYDIGSSTIAMSQPVNLAKKKRPSASRPRNKSTSPAEEEEKPFKCQECTKAFRRSEHLKRHIRSVHSSERPFHCSYCDKKFSRSDNLSQHLKTHKKHGDF